MKREHKRNKQFVLSCAQQECILIPIMHVRFVWIYAKNVKEDLSILVHLVMILSFFLMDFVWIIAQLDSLYPLFLTIAL